MTIQMTAEHFFNAYQVLRGNDEALIESLGGSSGKVTKQTNILGAYPTMGVDIVCLAFSVELYIKDIHHAIKGEIPRDHNILQLFEDLPEQIQQKIFAYDSISQNPFITRGDIFSTKKFTSAYSAYDGFIDQIKAISDGFIKWRYSYECATLNYDVSFALAFIESIKSVSSEVRKHSSVRNN